MPAIKTKQYSHCAEEAFYAFWLSLVNCVAVYNNFTIHTAPENNPFKCQFFVCSPQYKNNERIPLYENGVYHFCYTKEGKPIPIGMSGIVSPEQIALGCFEFAESFFSSHNLIEPLQWLLPDYAYFQHLNYESKARYEKLFKDKGWEMENKSEKILFPTLALDWTWDKKWAETVATADGNKGTVMTISFEKYREWSRQGRNATIEVKGCLDAQGRPLPPYAGRTPVFGLETHRNTDNFDDEKPALWGSENNKWMVEQNGTVIFWPWDYHIADLLEQNKNKSGIGWDFDFRLEENALA
jgi:hypothetical protein